MPVTIYGAATWYNTCNAQSSGTPNGACGTCYRDVPGVAYPNLLNHGTDWAYACGLPMPRIACGTVLTIVNDDCSVGASITAPVVDKGPNLPRLGCPDKDFHCSLTRAPLIIDLTEKAFTDLGGQLPWGIMGLHIIIP